MDKKSIDCNGGKQYFNCNLAICCFWIIEAVQFKLFGIPFVQLFENYPPYKTTNGWWIVYLIVGAVASMLIGEIISAVKQGIGRVTKKILMKPYKM